MYIQQLRQRIDRNPICPLMEVICEKFAETLGAISFWFIVSGGARRPSLRDPDGPIGGTGCTRSRKTDSGRIATVGGAHRALSGFTRGTNTGVLDVPRTGRRRRS